jgi:hypothetical protein
LRPEDEEELDELYRQNYFIKRKTELEKNKNINKIAF